jgi:hypothetical protein
MACDMNGLGPWLTVEASDEAVKATPSDHPDRVGSVNNLGASLGRRFERTGAMDNLNHAVEASNEAVKATPRSSCSSWLVE